MAKPSGQNTMKPITINAMVAGVQAGRINADVFIFSHSFGWRQPEPAAWNRNGKAKTAIQDNIRQNRTKA
ncbi:hypothetical protein MesoLj113b_04290 [Mesorhizobium sp. 113-3-3]|nr:hypothetical protein MesoLj113b_04290 [Mesorhizobium sp. 113-3-3]